MWIRVLIVALCTFVIVGSSSPFFPVGEVGTDASLDAFTEHMDTRIPELMREYEIPGVSVALVHEGNLVWSNAYGYADLHKHTPLTKEARLRVQSISKSVTAWGVMKLVEQGHIELDAPVQSYLKNWSFPESSYATETLTVRQLLNHSAGLPLGDIFLRYSPKDEMPSLKERLSAEVFLFQEPGARFSYSNTGFNLLELLIEEVTGRTFSSYMEQEILLPLGMDHSSFQWSEVFDPPVPNGYDLKGREIPVYVYPEKASGGLFATAEDIGLFLTAGMAVNTEESSILDQKSIEELYSPNMEHLGLYTMVFDSYGLGHYIERLKDGSIAVSHGGQGTGWMSHFHSIPVSGDGIVLLANSQRSWPMISYVLADWSHWIGHSPLGMSRIATADFILWIVVGLILFLALLILWTVADGLLRRRLLIASLSVHLRWQRLIQLVTSLSIIAILVWCANQKYLFLTSVFPISSIWLGTSAFLLAAVILLSAFCINRES